MDVFELQVRCSCFPHTRIAYLKRIILILGRSAISTTRSPMIWSLRQASSPPLCAQPAASTISPLQYGYLKVCMHRPEDLNYISCSWGSYFEVSYRCSASRAGLLTKSHDRA